MLDDSTSRGEPGLAMKLGWNARLRVEYTGSHARALLALPNYRQWIGAADEHCVLPYNRFWWRRAADEWSSGATGDLVDGSIAEWLGSLAWSKQAMVGRGRRA